MIWHPELLQAWKISQEVEIQVPNYAKTFFAFEDVGRVEHGGADTKMRN